MVDAVAEQGASARILGGVAVLLHCGTAHREPEDIDLVIARDGRDAMERVLLERGYRPNSRFNALHGDTRTIHEGPEGKLDVFVGDFSMCHSLSLGERLDADRPTISVADLLLTKLQVVELTEKDLSDLRALLGAHELAEEDGDVINAGRVAQVLGDDWGYWRTATATLERVADADPALSAKAAALRERVDAEPKSRRYRMRARIGERRRWYELPETVGG